VVTEEKRKSCRHPVEPATARREGSCGEKWRSRIAYGVGVVETVMLWKKHKTLVQYWNIGGLLFSVFQVFVSVVQEPLLSKCKNRAYRNLEIESTLTSYHPRL
jgi:hypothetical protein